MTEKTSSRYDVLPYEESLRQYFIDFNTAWILTYFKTLEAQDYETFSRVDELIRQDAMIFFAFEKEDETAEAQKSGNRKAPAACCMCKPDPERPGSWEVCKLASDLSNPHPGAGSAVFEAAVNWALDHGAEHLFLVGNTCLKAAVHIYEKFGFQPGLLEGNEYARGNICYEYWKTPVSESGKEDGGTDF